MKQAVKLLNSFQNKIVEAGCDEAGRGCYAGPVFAAAVILPLDFFHPQLNDSKQIKASIRLELKEFIRQHASAYHVAMVDVEEINFHSINGTPTKDMAQQHTEKQLLKTVYAGIIERVLILYRLN
ncbi:MAG: hypothetical protein IPH58_08675 [Sphingobacteriales bacterium]|nr:hypothetical protein [Sphingobacteriales bacterium]